MSGYVSELLDYLELYKLLLEEGYYDQSKKKEATQLMELIDSLNNCKSDNNYTSFDFGVLKKKIGTIFHPDIYKTSIPAEYNIDNVSVLAKINGILDDISKSKKDKSFEYNPSKPFTKETEEDYTYNDYFYDNERFKPREKDEDFKREERSKERKEKMDAFFTEVKTDFYKTKDYICEVAKERFNAMFRDIPSNEKDYSNIKNRFEGALYNLSSRESVLSNTLNILRSKLSELSNNWKMDSSNYSVEKFYNNELERRISILKNTEADLGRATIMYKSMLRKYAPEYNQLMKEWFDTSSEIYRDIVNTNNELNNKIVYDGDDKSIKESRARLNSLSKEQKNYPNINEAKTKVNNYLLSTHEDFKKAFERFFGTKAKYDEVYKSYEYWYSHPREEKDNYFNNLHDRYQLEYDKIDSKIRKIEKKHLKVTRLIFDTRVRYDNFLEKYQNTFENSEQYEEARSNTR